MNNLTKVLTIVIVLAVLGIVVKIQLPELQANLVEPGFSMVKMVKSTNPSSEPTPSPNAPKTFQLDQNTDLKLELEKVNPAVLDSDFK